MTDTFSSPSIVNLTTALFNFQASLKPLYKDSKNPFLRNSYVSLSAVLETVRPLLLDCDLLLIQRTMPADSNSVCVETRLIHRSGEWIASLTTIPLPQQTDSKLNPGQQAGAAISYAKRYGVMTLLTLATTDEDTDCEVRTSATTAQPKPKQSTQQSQEATPNLPQIEGINYRRVQDASGNVCIAATGNTLPVKDQLRDFGFSWNQQQRAWLRPAV